MMGTIVSADSVARTVELRPHGQTSVIVVNMAEHITAADCTVDSECSFDGSPDRGWLLNGVITA